MGDAATILKGELVDLNFVDVLQLVSQSRRNGTLHLHLEHGATATMLVSGGELLTCAVGDLFGDAALLALFNTTDGRFEFVKDMFDPEPGHGLSQSWQKLLLHQMPAMSGSATVRTMVAWPSVPQAPLPADLQYDPSLEDEPTEK